MESTTGNVEAMKRMYRAYTRGDVEAMLREVDPGVEVVPLAEVSDRPFHGHQGMRQFFRDKHIGEDVEYSVSKFQGKGDLVLMLGRVRRRRDGALVDAPAAWVGTLRDGKLVRSHAFSSWEEALAAAGMDGRP